MKLFSTDFERDCYFESIEKDPRSVPYGAALTRAALTDVGLFDDKNVLLQDVARIMACEVTRTVTDTDQPSWHMNIDSVLASARFRAAYCHARFIAVDGLVTRLNTYGMEGLAKMIGDEHREVALSTPVAVGLTDLTRAMEKAFKNTLCFGSLEVEGELFARSLIDEMKSGLRPPFAKRTLQR